MSGHQADIPRLDEYHFYEREWDSYEQLVDEFEWEVPDQFNIATYICDRWADDNSDVAFFLETEDGHRETYTFWQLQKRSNQLANYLADQGVGKGDRVAVSVPQKPPVMIAQIAIWKLGAVSVPLSTHIEADGLRYRFGDAEAKACIFDVANIDTLRTVADDLPTLGTVLTVDATTDGDDEDDFWNAIDGHSKTYDTASTAHDEIAIIFYTSGTTGDPKGVLYSHEVLLGFLPHFVMMSCNMDIDNNIFWASAEPAWAGVLFTLYCSALFYGRPFVMYHSDRIDADDTFRLVEDYGITNFFQAPRQLRELKNQATDPSDDYRLNSVDFILIGGEALGNDMYEWVDQTFSGATVLQGYGQTEVNQTTGECEALDKTRRGSIGVGVPGHDLLIVDPDDPRPETEVPTGEVGELIIRYDDDPVCFEGYLGQPEKTEEKIQNGWVISEDLLYQDEDGFYFFYSRKDDVIIGPDGIISPDNLEEALAEHPAVGQPAVIGVPNPDGSGDVPKAYVVLTDAYEPSDDLADELLAYVAGMDRDVALHAIEFTDNLPLTSTGKVSRTELEKREES